MTYAKTHLFRTSMLYVGIWKVQSLQTCPQNCLQTSIIKPILDSWVLKRVVHIFTTQVKNNKFVYMSHIIMTLDMWLTQTSPIGCKHLVGQFFFSL